MIPAQTQNGMMGVCMLLAITAAWLVGYCAGRRNGASGERAWRIESERRLIKACSDEIRKARELVKPARCLRCQKRKRKCHAH